MKSSEQSSVDFRAMHSSTAPRSIASPSNNIPYIVITTIGIITAFFPSVHDIFFYQFMSIFAIITPHKPERAAWAGGIYDEPTSRHKKSFGGSWALSGVGAFLLRFVGILPVLAGPTLLCEKN